MNDAFQVTIVSKLEMFQVMLSSKLRVVYERIPISSRNFFCRGRESYPSTPLGVQPRPFHVNVEIKSRSPRDTEDFTGMLEKDEIKHKI